MARDDTFWARMLPAIRVDDPDEVVAKLRHLLNAEPFEITPRYWLAEIHRREGNVALAIGQYDRLLPLAVGAGDVFRSLAIQKRLDELDPRPGAADRFAAIHRWFRLLGVGHLIEAPSTHGAGLSARALIHLPGDAFVRAASHATLESFTREPRVLALDGAEQHVLLFGELIWDVKLADGRQRREQHAVAGDLLRVDPEFARTGRMRVRPETPAESLRFGARLLAELVQLDPNIVGVSPFGDPGIVREERVLLSARPRRPEDIDRRSELPRHDTSGAPPRLDPSGAAPPPGLDDDVETWVGYGSLTLDPGPLDLSTVTAARVEDVSMIDLEARAASAARRGRPVVEPPASLEMSDGLVVPVSRDPFATPAGDLGTPIERRRADRVLARSRGRIRLMGIAGAPQGAMECHVEEVSAGGLGVRFTRGDIVNAIAILQGEVLRLELDVPASEPLRLAARMRWVDLGEPECVRAGLQFVLLVPDDRVALERLIGRTLDATPDHA